MSNIERLARELLVVIGVRPKTYSTFDDALAAGMADRLNNDSNPVGASQLVILPDNQQETNEHEEGS